jgi:hypothetical protein
LEPDLFGQCPNVIDRVVARSIKFGDVEAGVVVEGNAAVTFVAGLVVFRAILAIQYLGQDSGRGGLTNTTWTTEKESVGQVIGLQSILQCSGYMLLADDFIEADGAILAGGNNEVGHRAKVGK